MIRVLLYSEDATLQRLLSSSLGKEFRVSLTPRAEEVARQRVQRECDVVLFEMNAKSQQIEDRIETARTAVGSEGAPWIVMADDELREEATELVELGAYNFCRRPPSVRDLRALLRQAYESAQPKMEPKPEMRPSGIPIACDRLIGSSAPMQQVYRVIDAVKDIQVSVLINGQSGTGKELVARAIHNLGRNAARPFVAVPCGAIPETLIESELFGHEKGAFTGSVGSRAGYFEQAEDGTVFLDEIAELSLFTQVKLLRVLQEREFNRLGGTRPIPLRARLIFATNRNLPEMVAQGRLREDLYYRMNVVTIRTPSLSEHGEDLALIATHFLRHYSNLFGKPMERIADDALALLKQYNWPGNVRELENVIQQAIVLAGARELRAGDLPLHIREENVVRLDGAAMARDFEHQVREFKLKLLNNALRQHRGNKTLAARSLGISRAYLHRLLRAGGSEGEMEEEEPMGGAIHQLP